MSSSRRIPRFIVPYSSGHRCVVAASFLCLRVVGLCLNHTVQKDSREVLGTSFRFGPTSEILENIQYGGSSVVKTDSKRSRFIPREALFRVLLTRFAFIVTFEEFLVLYSKQSIYKCLIS